jgi:hypothetical protein
MAFPTNPVNGQQATVNGVIYTYVSATPAWSVTTNAGANVSANNISAVAAITAASVSATGNVYAGNLINAGSLTVTTLTVGSSVSAVGNITASYILGNGSQLTGVAASYGNANVAAYLPTYNGAIGASTLTATTVNTGSLSLSGNITSTLNVTGAVNSGALTATSLTETSSIVFKENVRPLENSLEIIGQLAGVMYDLRDGSVKDDIGLIAEDVYKIAPGLVSLNAEGKPHGLRYPRISAYLIESIKDLQIQINQLKKG